MDNASKAIVMAGSILLFLVALSTAVYMYSHILSVNDQILTNSEYYGRTAENILNLRDTQRTISGAEVANQILEMVNKSDDFHYSQIKVGDKSYTDSNKAISLLAGDIGSIVRNNYVVDEVKFISDQDVSIVYKIKN